MTDTAFHIYSFVLSAWGSIAEWFFIHPLAQSIGILGFIASLYTFLSKNDALFLKRLTLTSIVWAIHFLLLGAISAGLLNTVDIIKNILAIYFPMNKRIAVVMVLVYITIGSMVFASSGSIIDWLPVLGSIASTIILFTLKGVWMRVGFVCVLFGWLAYNFSVQSLGGMATDTILLITGIIGIFRYTEEKKSS